MNTVLSLFGASFRVLVFVVLIATVACRAQGLENVEIFVDEYGYSVERTFFLMDDGTLRGTGDNRFGQLGIDGEGDVDRADAVIATDVKEVSTGQFHTLILKNDGSLWGVGGNDDGQLGLGHYEEVRRPVEIVSSGVISIAAGLGVSYFVKDDGSLWGMGRRTLLVESTEKENYKTAIMLEESGVSKVYASHGYMILLNMDGTVYGRHIWGSPYYFGGLENDSSFRWQLSFEDEKITRVEAGWDYCLFRDQNGKMWGAGDGVYRLGLAPFSGYGASQLGELPLWLVPSGFSAGVDRVLFWDSSGVLWTQSDIGASFEPDLDVGTIKRAFAGNGYSIVVKEDGKSYGIGSVYDSILGTSLSVYYSEYSEFAIPPAPNAHVGKNEYAIDLDNSGSESFKLSAEDSQAMNGATSYRWAWDGEIAEGIEINREFPLGKTVVSLSVEDSNGRVDTDEMVVEVLDASYYHKQEGNPFVTSIAVWSAGGFIVRSDGSLWAVGDNGDGIFGDGTNIDESSFVEILPYGVTDVTNGGVVLMEDGSVRRLEGSNEEGDPYQLNIVIESGATAISGTDEHTLVLLGNGSVLAWGSNWLGSVGDGTTDERIDPVEVVTSGCVGVSTSNFSSFFYMEDGSAWGTGYLGDRIVFNEPTKLFDAGIVQIETDVNGAFLITDEGVAYRTHWEDSTGESEYEYVLTKVDPLEDGSLYRVVDYSPNMIWFLTDDGKLITKISYEYDGFNDEGDLTDSDGYQVVFDSGVVAISAVQWVTFILKDDGSVWGMGEMHNANILVNPVLNAEDSDTVHISLAPPEFYPEGPFKLVPEPLGQTRVDAGESIVAVFSGITENASVQLDGSLSWDFNGIDSWTWYWDGVESSGEIASFQLPVGTHEIVLEIENRFGIKSNANVKVQVIASEIVRSWLNQYFSEAEIEEMGESFYTQDSDDDGFPNVVEMMYGMSPLYPFSKIPLIFEIIDGEHFVRIPYWFGDRLELFSSDDMEYWYEVSSQVGYDKGGGETFQVLKNGGTFYQVKVNLPSIQGD